MASTQASTSAANEGRHITILYMTQTGTSQDVALRIARQAKRKRYTVDVADVADYDVNDLVSESLVLFLVSTTGQGEFPTSARPFWNFLLRKGIPEDILADLTFAAFGLGDTTYSRFCWPVRLLSRRLNALGAVQLVEHGEGDDMHYLGLEGSLGPWLDGFWSRLDELLPLPEGLEEIGRDEVLPPVTKLEKVADGSAWSSDTAGEGFNTHLQGQGWTLSKLCKNERMTAADHFQDVRLLEFAASPASLMDQEDNGLRVTSNENSAHRDLAAGVSGVPANNYRPGDVLCLHPVNDVASVTEILSRLGLDPDTLVTISGPTVPPTVPLSPHRMSLRCLFTHHLDFTSVPTRSFFDQIRLFSPAGSLEREKLDEYCGIYPAEELAKGANPQDGIDEMFEYAQRPKRTIKEVLEEFKSVTIPLEYVADVFPWIKPREFSIASAPPTTAIRTRAKHDKRAEEVQVIQLSVAIVKYKTRLRKPRTGLCTRWLAQLPVGADVPILLKDGYVTLPPADAPLILVGPGTGCAPLRSLVLERLSSSTCTPAPEIHLFLGFRNRSKDYLFSSDWEALSSAHPDRLHLHTAFSRDGERKTYVQDLIVDEENSQVLWNAIVQKNAWIIVAGSTGKMPEQVRAAFEGLAEKWGGMDPEQGKRFLDSLERQRRWQEECWS